ncbi:hypothetical protein [Corynebacterium vitaeruminis]|uniref:hypothetical protein n=1 Tax=Corynebacterium vitaeruminis TaxID=38305 RepID=UPI0028A66CC0|nr:hypothetical protein [Corynebacterium vitaeruminis]
MSKKKTSDTVIVDTILATGMTHAEAAELFDVSQRWIRKCLNNDVTVGEPTCEEILGHYALQEGRKYHSTQLHA